MRDLTISEFLRQLGARVPAPGGGATAALHAAQGAALLSMVARYSTGERYAGVRDAVTRILAEAEELGATALRLAEEDAAAFTRVGDAYKLPKATAGEKAARSAAIDRALVGAARPPAATVVVAGRLVALAEALVPIGNRNVLTDVAAAAEAARAAASTARINVEINLGGIKDEAVRAGLLAAIADVDQILAAAEAVTSRVREEIVK